ncbi:MAG TPA: hemerythrin domain-containing protein [Pyrinomonadaceae bacterium]|jgi:iron-sulfur cluster repair protein YtfE (RIC family)
MNAFELLKQDHEKVSGIFEQIEETTERAVKTREELYGRLRTELDIHSQIEEEVFYPAIEELDETRALTLEAYEEHNVVKQLLDELDALPVDDETWTAKLKVLHENVDHHVEEEETELFPLVRQVLTSEAIEELGVRLQAAKQTHKRAAAG